ncbi:MAG: nucleoside triphosphate pyrophosphohydrolase [Proteobacteria bacterium]|nr:nucleoside triphosphate pyrophosphohydrolase [Pseudomonadota bacterium]
MTHSAPTALARVLEVIDRLLDPETGCPWDRRQTPDTAKNYVLEETYELVEAVDGGRTAEVVEEMGDCFFMLCFLGRLFERTGAFGLESCLAAAADKMIGRHPHVFGAGRALEDAEAVKAQWHEIKQKEKAGSSLQGVPRNLPALNRTHRLTERAGRVGFDWNGPEAVLNTVADEIRELEAAMAQGDPERVKAEMGDVLFTLGNLARHLKINAEEALRAANTRFQRRFEYIEARLAERGLKPEQAGLAEMDRLWAQAKAEGL